MGRLPIPEAAELRGAVPIADAAVGAAAPQAGAYSLSAAADHGWPLDRVVCQETARATLDAPSAGGRFLVERDRKPVAMLVSVEDGNRLDEDKVLGVRPACSMTGPRSSSSALTGIATMPDGLVLDTSAAPALMHREPTAPELRRAIERHRELDGAIIVPEPFRSN